jgi:hypothetical protein
MSEIFGGPARDRQDGDAQDGDGRGGGDSRVFTARLTEEQRARWVVLAGHAATEAGLPTDPPFRAALASYLEWDSRQAQARPGDSPQERAAGGPQQPARRPARRRGGRSRRQPGKPARGGAAARAR